MTTETLYKLTPGALSFLQTNMERNIEMYGDPGADFGEVLAGHEPRYMVDSGVRIDPKTITVHEGAKPNKSDSQCLAFYRSFEGMVPRMASDPHILSYMNHFYLHEFGIARWLPRDGATPSKVENHWFRADNPNNSKWNIAGRLWWMGRMAVKIAEASDGRLREEDVVYLFSNTAEYYHMSLDFEVMRNYKILAECLILLKDREVTTEQYRSILRAVNREAGACLVDSFDRISLNALVMQAYDSALSTR